MKNTLLTFLEQLGVPHTRQYANRLYAEHPNRHNMLGLSQMLQTYGVRTQGVHLPPERLADLPMPCILHLSGRFVVAVEATPQGRIGYVWQGGRRYDEAAVVRQWCVLCLLVQGVVWAGGIAAALLWQGSLTATATWVAQLMQWGALAALAVVVTHKLAEGTTQARGSLEATYRYRALKADVGVFTALLRRAPYHATSAADSAIVIGPADAALGITILTNPHCEPCGRMHQRVEQLLQAAGQGQVSVRYIFKSFTEELEESSRFLIAAHQQLPPAEARRVYADWYAGGKYHARAFMARHPQVEAHTPQVEAELARHHAWQARTGLVATPTVLVGGYVLPPEYTLEDLLPLAGRELDLTPPQGHTTENIIDDIGANKRPLHRPRRHEPRE